jgi:hypothetical protein
MSDLLELALAAHGGPARWNSVDRISARASISGGSGLMQFYSTLGQTQWRGMRWFVLVRRP